MGNPKLNRSGTGALANFASALDLPETRLVVPVWSGLLKPTSYLPLPLSKLLRFVGRMDLIVNGHASQTTDIDQFCTVSALAEVYSHGTGGLTVRTRK